MSLSERVPEALVEELEQRFPDQCPSIEDSDRMVWLKVGRAEVIRFLKKQYEIQNRNIMTGDSEDEIHDPDEEF